MKKWERATNYLGEEYYNYYIIYSQTRDSDVLERANFEAALKMLGGERGDKVIVVRANHWAVGWVETILVHEKAKKYLEIAREIERNLKKYSVLDDRLYSDMVLESYQDAYKSWARDDAKEILRRNGVEKISNELLYDVVIDILYCTGGDGLDEGELIELYQKKYDDYRDSQIMEYEQKVGQRKLF